MYPALRLEGGCMIDERTLEVETDIYLYIKKYFIFLLGNMDI